MRAVVGHRTECLNAERMSLHRGHTQRPTNSFIFPASRGIALSPLSLAQAEPHGSSNHNNQTFPEEENHEIHGGVED